MLDPVELVSRLSPGGVGKFPQILESASPELYRLDVDHQGQLYKILYWAQPFYVVM